MAQGKQTSNQGCPAPGQPPAPPQNPEVITAGLWLCGEVIRRTKRCIGEKNNVLVSYFVSTEEGVRELQQWDPKPETPVFPRGQVICVKVTPSVRNGFVSFRLPGSEFDF